MTNEPDKYCERKNRRSTGSGRSKQREKSGWTASEEEQGRASGLVQHIVVGVGGSHSQATRGALRKQTEALQE